MATMKTGTFREWLRSCGDSVPLANDMRRNVEAKGRTIDEVTEMHMRVFVYEGEPIGEWKTNIPVSIKFYELSFADKTFINQFWDSDHSMPLSYEEVKEALDLKKLLPDDRQFIEEYPRNNQFRDFAEKLFDDLPWDDINIDMERDGWEARWKHRIAQRAYDLAWHLCYEISDLRGVQLSNGEMLDAVPDLTKWPEESKIV